MKITRTKKVFIIYLFRKAHLVGLEKNYKIQLIEELSLDFVSGSTRRNPILVISLSPPFPHGIQRRRLPVAPSSPPATATPPLESLPLPPPLLFHHHHLSLPSPNLAGASTYLVPWTIAQVGTAPGGAGGVRSGWRTQGSMPMTTHFLPACVSDGLQPRRRTPYQRRRVGPHAPVAVSTLPIPNPIPAEPSSHAGSGRPPTQSTFFEPDDVFSAHA